MTVTIRPARHGKGWDYDINIHWPEGGRDRERAKAPVPSKSGALKWALARESAHLAAGRAAFRARRSLVIPADAPEKTPTLSAYWPRFVRDHYVANRKKPSTVDAAQTIFKRHLAPRLGARPLDRIMNSDVAALKGALADAKPKTVNNILAVLGRALRSAVSWGVISTMPCQIEFLPTTTGDLPFYEVHDYRRLVEGARKMSTGHHVLVLLMGSAGLRRGEVIALKWSDIDLTRKQMRVDRAFWRQHENTPKGGRGRPLPLTDELVAALKAHRPSTGMRGDDPRVLYSAKGRQLSNRCIRNWVRSAERRAGMPLTGRAHVLRHTFCSHLAIAGVPAKAIQELAGHADLKTTLRYMHLSPANRSTAMAALEGLYVPTAAMPAAKGVGK
jgi:integrase